MSKQVLEFKLRLEYLRYFLGLRCCFWFLKFVVHNKY